MTDKILKNFEVISPEHQIMLTPELVVELAQRFPNIIKEEVMEKLKAEVLDYTSSNL